MIDETLSPDEYNYTLAHEVGHHILGHFDRAMTKQTREDEASIFAAVFTCLCLYDQWRAYQGKPHQEVYMEKQETVNQQDNKKPTDAPTSKGPAAKAAT